jgi:hypothetical protein
MEKLFCSRTDVLADESHPETLLWVEGNKLISLNISLIDRVGQIEMPYRFETYKPFKMPTDLTGFDLTYEQCCEKRAWEMVYLSRSLNKPIALFYSGGIDSTLMLITFMKILSDKELRERIWVCLNLKSVYENSRFYFDHVIKKCTIKSSYLLSSMLDNSVIILGGEHNDQLFGSDTVSEIINMYGYDPVLKPYTKEFIIKFFCQRNKYPLSPAAAEIWFDVIDYHIQNHAPCELKTVFDFFWWFNFCFKWQSVYFRMLLRVDIADRHNITQDFVEKYYHHFYSTIDFQKWSMCNPQEKIRDSWKSYKIKAKELIYDFNQDDYYFKHKIKNGSLNDLFRFKAVPDAFTNHFRFINEIDKNDFYNANNSFIR